MKNKTGFFPKFISVLLIFSTALSFVSVAGGFAEAAPSLPYVEQIKTSGETFNILEIVPDESQGSIGYYIAGSEPWVKLAGKQSKENRAAYINSTLRAYLNKKSEDEGNSYYLELCNPDGAAASDAYPLSYTTNYCEACPWEPHDGFFEMPLNHEETAYNVKGSFVPRTNGEYVENNSYAFVSNGTGKYVQFITGFSTTQMPGSYYYSVTFAEISYDPSAPEIPKWSLIYRTAENGEPADLTVDIGGIQTKLCAVGVTGTPDFPGLDVDRTYYRAVYGDPSPAYSASSAPYRAVSHSFREKEPGEKGYFNRTENSFRYVGTGGNYGFVPGSGGESNTISYSTVYYKGGFENNNWFLKYVFDWSSGENMPKLSVRTLSPSGVTEDMVNSADLIVINYGLNIEGNSYGSIFLNDFKNDLSAEVFNAIWSKCAASSQENKIPVLFDYNLKFCAQPRIKDLAAELLNAENATNAVLSKDYDSDKNGNKHVTYVSSNQYCINSAMYKKIEEGKEAFYFGLPLAGNWFNDTSQIYGDPTRTSNPFYPVYEDICYENFLREIRTEAGKTSISALDSGQITMATSIRHIINSVKKRKVENKTALKVLDIEPRSGSLTSAQKNTLASWLGIRAENLSVTSMSTAEFVGRREDLRKEYDLIYLGESLDGFETSGGKTDYYDNDMDGLIYSNTGDIVRSGFGSQVSGYRYGLSGLLERDYSNSNMLNDNDDTCTFRYSGNDITKAAAKRIENFAKSGYPIIVGDKLLSNRLEISPDNNAVDGIAYIGNGFYWHPFTRCYYSTDTGNSDTNNLILNVRISRQIIYLSYIPPFIFYCGGRIKTADCTLYRNGTTVSSRNISGSNAVSFDLSGYNSGDKFYCDIKVNSAYSTFGSVKSGYTNDPKGRTVSYTLYKGPNPAYVDANSNLYDLLGTICTKKNVKSWSAVSNSDLNKNLLKRYVNLPKPDIVFSKNANGSYVKYPTVYSIENGKMNSLIRTEGVNRLEYVFKIQNAADPLPQNTRYTCNLYIDMDGNGSFSENEIINDAGIREWKNASPGVRVANGNLSADKEYYLFYELPDSKVGLVPWKISIADNVYMAYDDEVNYTRVLPLAVEPVKTVEILQIAPDAGTINLQEQTAEAASGGYPSSVTGKSYRGIIGKLLADVSEDIKVRVTTVSASTVNNVSSRNPLSHTFIDKDGNIKTVQYSDPGLYLASFDMLVLGFGDSYGELSTDTVKAVSKFIDSNRPVLMTHDTTSFYSLPRADFRVRYGNVYVYGSKDAKINGYSVNMLLRGKIGMDRYGVADPVYGYTSYIPDEITKRTPKRPGPVADSYSGADVSGIKNAGYDIAYKAKSLGNADSISSLKGKTVPETQGLTNGVLARFLLSGKMPFKNARFSTNDTNDKAGFTTTVSQLNKGQITTYPYDVNTALFKGVGSDNSMTVADTHFQYYQLNMNPDDMVVWYCLEDDTSGKYPDSNIYAKNDAANSYYIYTCGNITYSGMGHSKDINETEAKLFVNTLIAAYRTGESAPTVSFSNKDGTKKGIDSFFIPCDGDSILVPAGGGDESRRIYFTVNDSNISQSKIIKAAFRCGNSGTELSLSVYDAETDKAVSTLTSTYTYYVKLDELLTELNKQGISIGGGLNFSVTVTSELPSGNKKTGSAVISLRKLALFPLS